MRARIFFSIVFLLLFAIQCKGQEYPREIRASQGVADLRALDFSEGASARLTGFWEFYPGEFYSPQQFSAGKISAPVFVEVPHSWDKPLRTENNEAFDVPQKGVATYRLRLLLPENRHEYLYLSVPPTDSPFRMYVNGEEALKNGDPYKEGKAIPEYYAPLGIHVNNQIKEAEIIIHLSSYRYPRGGLRSAISIGREENMESTHANRMGIELFLLGAILIMAIYHLTLYIINLPERTTFYFAGISLVVAVRIAVTGEGILYQTGLIDWRFGTLLEYLSFYMSLPLFALFTNSLYPQEMPKRFFLIYVYLPLVFILIVIFSPIWVYAQTLFYFNALMFIFIVHFVIALVTAFVRKRNGAGVFLSGGTILGLTVVSDMLYNMRIVPIGYISPAGFFAFFFFQSVLLARRFSQAFQLVQGLSTDLEIRVKERTNELEVAKRRSEDLLRNILPEKIARELQNDGIVQPQSHASVSVMFADFVNFTSVSQTMTAEEIVWELDTCYSAFDAIVIMHNLEKLKTMGDAYMCAGGIPEPRDFHEIDIVLAGLDFLRFVENRNEKKPDKFLPWHMRIGIHAGPIVAGVVGRDKFLFDIWGDTVNTASRMEKYSDSDKVNISAEVHEKVKDFFVCEERGKTEVKGKGEMQMYFVLGIRPELSVDGKGEEASGEFYRLRDEKRKFLLDPEDK